MHIGKRALSDSYATLRNWPASSQWNATTSSGIAVAYIPEKAQFVHFDSRLKAPLNEMKEIGFPSKKNDRLLAKIDALTKENFPISNQKKLKTIYHAVSKIKKLHANSENYDQPSTYSLSLYDDPCEVDVYPFYDNTGSDGKNKLRHEAILSFVYPDSEEIDKRKHLECGSTKFISFGWLMGKQPKRVVRAVTHFEKPEDSSGFEYWKIQRTSANREAFYLNLFNNHPGFPKAYKSHNLVSKNIIIMNHYPSDLYLEVTKGQKIDDFKKIQILIEVFSSLRAMHEINVCHRDIKFENFLMDNEGHPIACDFGFCCKADNSKEINEPHGTISCMSLEKLENYFLRRELTEEDILASDIWSAGQLAMMLLWENISIPTFEINRKDFKDDLLAVREQMQLLSDYEPPKGDLLTHLIWETLHIKPNRRPSANEVVERLTNIQKQYVQHNPTYTIKDTNDYWNKLLTYLDEIHKSKIESSSLSEDTGNSPHLEKASYSSSTSSY